MNADNYVSIGKFMGTHGVNGELVLKHALGKETSLKGLTTIFIFDKSGNYLPWFVEKAKGKSNDEVVMKIEGVNTKEAARQMVKKQVWLNEADFKKFASKTAAISMLGYTINSGGIALGTVQEVIEQPHQILCSISIDGKEAFIPLHQDSLLKIDATNKIIFVQLPEGLLDIYLA